MLCGAEQIGEMRSQVDKDLNSMYFQPTYQWPSYLRNTCDRFSSGRVHLQPSVAE